MSIRSKKAAAIIITIIAVGFLDCKDIEIDL